MIDTTSMDRIIGDFLEVNSNIVSREFNSKFPKFISKWISKRERNKLLLTLSKFRNSEYVLNWINLIELFTYINSNFDIDHSFGVVTRSEIFDDRLEAIVEFDSYHAIIYFDQLPTNLTEESKFNLKMKYITSDRSDGIDIYLSRLKGTSKKSQEFVDELNYVLRNCISDYIEETIKRYMEDK